MSSIDNYRNLCLITPKKCTACEGGETSCIYGYTTIRFHQSPGFCLSPDASHNSKGSFAQGTTWKSFRFPQSKLSSWICLLSGLAVVTISYNKLQSLSSTWFFLTINPFFGMPLPAWWVLQHVGLTCKSTRACVVRIGQVRSLSASSVFLLSQMSCMTHYMCVCVVCGWAMKYLHFELAYCIFGRLPRSGRCLTKKYSPSKPFAITGKKAYDFSNILINLSRAQPPTPSRISKSDIRTFQQGAIISWKSKQDNPCCRHSNSLGKLTQNHTNNIARVHHKILCMLQQRQSVAQDGARPLYLLFWIRPSTTVIGLAALPRSSN